MVLQNHKEYGDQIYHNDAFFPLNESNYDSIDTSEFDCGNSSINNFIIKEKYKDPNNGVTYAFVDGDCKLIGFTVLNCSGIHCTIGTTIETKSAIEIVYFAMDKKYHGMQYCQEDTEDYTLSQYLFETILCKIQTISWKVIGANYVILYAVPRAVSFYTDKFFFEKFNQWMISDNKLNIKDCEPLFIEIE